MKSVTNVKEVGVPWLAALAVAWAMAGCSSGSPSRFVAPRMTGRTLDAQTHQPIAGVRVRRGEAAPSSKTGDLPRASDVVEKGAVERTDRDGRFVLGSVRELSVFRRFGWYSVDLSFEHANYQRLTTNYTLASSTNTPAGEPVVHTGDILLQPNPR
jgi:hypothetical protein